MSGISSDQQRQRHAEFSEYLQRHQTQLFGYIHSLVRNSNDTDDIFQQTSIVLWRQFDHFDRNRNFLSWACGVARLEVSNYLRSRSRKRLYFSDELNLMLIESHLQMTHAEVDDRRRALSECVQKLRPPDRELLDECYAGELDVNSVAERRGRIPQSVHNTLRRIRRSLYECINRTMHQDDRRGFTV